MEPQPAGSVADMSTAVRDLASTDNGSDRNAVRPRPPVIAMRDISKVYGLGDTEVHALRSVNLTVERGDYLAIMGASGSGKSTLMNILGCLDVATVGRYHLAGVDVSDLSANELADIRNRRIGFVFQSFNLIARTSAVMNVEMPLVYGGMKRGARRRLAVDALTRVGLAERLEYFSNQLSGGQQQRVAIARAIITNPAMILADEPTGALDSISTREVLAIFDELNAEGRTVVVITHEDEVAQHAKRVIRLRDGLITDDTRRSPAGGLPPQAHQQETPS
ncbi:MAG: putative transport system ATP-binding protein [Acidimicrobiaceae bacterium]|nr:putative transport system ATP-binding protein [Acidimicrobiaceae bacterium]